MDQLLYSTSTSSNSRHHHKLDIFQARTENPPEFRGHEDRRALSDRGSQYSPAEDKENRRGRFRSKSNVTDSQRSSASSKKKSRHRHHVKKTFYEEYKESLPENLARHSNDHQSHGQPSSHHDDRETLESQESQRYAKSSLARRYNECIIKLKLNSQRHELVSKELTKITTDIEGLHRKRDQLLHMMNEIVDERDHLERSIDRLISKLNKRDLEYRSQSSGHESNDEPDHYSASSSEDENNDYEEERMSSQSESSSERRPSTLQKLTDLMLETAKNRSTYFQNDSGECIKTLHGHKGVVKCLDMNGTFDTMVSGSSDGLMHVWDMGTFNSMVSFPCHDTAVNCLQYDGSHVITGGQDRRINIWNIGSVANGTFQYVQDPELSLTGHFGGINSLQFDMDGTLVSAAQDGKIKIWDLNSQSCVQTFHTQATAPDLIFSAAGTYPELKRSNTLGSVWKSQGNIVERNIGLAAPLTKFESETMKGVTCLQFFQYALATGGQDGVVRFWDTRIKASSVPIFGGGDRAESPDSFTTVREHVNSSSCKRQLIGHSGPITCLKFDDTHLVTGGLDRTVRIWDLRMGTVVEGFTAPSLEGICDLQFDKQKIIVAAGSSSIIVFDRLKRSQNLLNGHESTVRSLKYLNDDLLVSGDNDGQIKVWKL